MLNDIDFDYIDLGLPNLLWAKEKAKTYDKRMQISARLAPLAFEAAKKFPRWKFVGTHNWEYPDYFDITRFTVYENREKIGVIGTNQTRHGTKYVIGNERIKNTRKRGGAMETGDLKKALALMAKSFGRKTIEDKSRAAYNKLSNAISSSHSAKQTEYNHAINYMLRGLETYALRNFEVAATAAIAAGADAYKVYKIPEHKDEHDTVSTIHNALNIKRGRFVMIDGSDYVVSKSLDFKPELYSSDTLPAPIKLGIGMLKLLEDNHFIKDVGFRLNAATFYVLAEPD